jgi:hypothetical protein
MQYAGRTAEFVLKRPRNGGDARTPIGMTRGTAGNAEREPCASSPGRDARAQGLEAARRRHPQRWRGATRNWQHIAVVHLNPDQTNTPDNPDKELTQPSQKAA